MLNKFIFIFILFISHNLHSNEDKSICGNTDDREFSSDPKIGRVNDGEASVCTVTLISDTCAISAGHCRWLLNEVSFNVPNTREGKLGRSIPKDRYVVDRDSIYFANNGVGDDYAVFKLLPNPITNKLPGEVQGYYDVSTERPNPGDRIYITGYGKDTRVNRNHSQQFHMASILRTQGNIMTHNIDTRFGNSGSVIIDSVTKKIIGIHTHGGCYAGGGANYGTLIFGHTRLKRILQSCLL